MVDMTNDVTRFEKIFADRFTTKDEKFIEIKSKPLPNPVVIYPWKTQRKVWNKRWDYSNHKTLENRSHGNQRDRDKEHHGEGNSRSTYRDRSPNRHEVRDRSKVRHDGRDSLLNRYDKRFTKST